MVRAGRVELEPTRRSGGGISLSCAYERANAVEFVLEAHLLSPFAPASVLGRSIVGGLGGAGRGTRRRTGAERGEWRRQRTGRRHAMAAAHEASGGDGARGEARDGARGATEASSGGSVQGDDAWGDDRGWCARTRRRRRAGAGMAAGAVDWAEPLEEERITSGNRRPDAHEGEVRCSIGSCFSFAPMATVAMAASSRAFLCAPWLPPRLGDARDGEGEGRAVRAEAAVRVRIGGREEGEAEQEEKEMQVLCWRRCFAKNMQTTLDASHQSICL
ncbi:hypothetical protein EJB05_06072, partial [Eragrostis curvula]